MIPRFRFLIEAIVCVHSGDTDGDREQQKSEEQMGGGVYEFSFVL